MQRARQATEADKRLDKALKAYSEHGLDVNLKKEFLRIAMLGPGFWYSVRRRLLCTMNSIFDALGVADHSAVLRLSPEMCGPFRSPFRLQPTCPT